MRPKFLTTYHYTSGNEVTILQSRIWAISNRWLDEDKQQSCEIWVEDKPEPIRVGEPYETVVKRWQEYVYYNELEQA